MSLMRNHRRKRKKKDKAKKAGENSWSYHGHPRPYTPRARKS